MKASNRWIGDDGNCVWSWFSCVQAGKTNSDQRLAPDSGWNAFPLVRGLESVSRCPARHPGRGDFLSMIEEAMSTMTIVFVLIILLFGFDSTGQVKTRVDRNSG